MYGVCRLCFCNDLVINEKTQKQQRHHTSYKLLFQLGTFSFLTSTRLVCPWLTARCRGDRRAMLRMLGSAPRSRRALQLSGLFLSTAQCRGALPCSSQLFRTGGRGDARAHASTHTHKWNYIKMHVDTVNSYKYTDTELCNVNINHTAL